MAFGSFSWDFTLLPLDDLYTIPNSYGAGGGTILDSPPPSAPPVINNVTVAIPPPIPSPSDPIPQIEAVQANQADSEAEYGRQAGPVIMTILSSIEAAEALAIYLGRPIPEYWYSELRVDLLRLSSGDQDLVAALEVGDQLRVSKRFTGVTDPVVQDLFVEGIEHEIRPNGHTVVIYTSPAVLWEPFELDVSELDDPAYGLGP